MSAPAALLAEVPPPPMIGTPLAPAAGVGVMLTPRRRLRPAPHLSLVEVGPPMEIMPMSPREASMVPASVLAARVWHGWAPHHWEHAISAIPLAHPHDTCYQDTLQTICTELVGEYLRPEEPDTASIIVDPLAMTPVASQEAEDALDAVDDYAHGLIHPVMRTAPESGLIGLFIQEDHHDPSLGRSLIGVGYRWTDHQWTYHACFMPLVNGAPRAWLSRTHTIDADDELPLSIHLWPHFFTWAPSQLAVMLRRDHLPYAHGCEQPPAIRAGA